jgi:hypothetical protein
MVEQGIERCIALLGEIKRLEDGLFVVESTGGGDAKARGRTEGMEIGMGGLSRLERKLASIDAVVPRS